MLKILRGKDMVTIQYEFFGIEIPSVMKDRLKYISMQKKTQNTPSELLLSQKIS